MMAPHMDVAGRGSAVSMSETKRHHPRSQGDLTMLSSTKIALAALAFTFIGGAQLASADQKQTAANPYECFTDDGYGRKRPCSAGYQQKRAEKPSYDCVTDDGYGRKRSCSANIKQGQK